MKPFNVARLLPALMAAVVCADVSAQEKYWPDSWTMAPRAGEIVFDVEPQGDTDRAHLHVRNAQNVGQLFMNAAIPLNDQTRLKWRWNMKDLPLDVAEDTPGTHHYYAVAVRFDNDQVLSYIWSAALPVGAVFPCPLPAWKDRETHVVLHSGSKDFGKWLAEERNLLADYRKYKKSPPPGSIVQVWVIAAAATGDGEMTLADISVSDARSANRFLSGRGFSARDQRIAAIHATLPGLWSGQSRTLDAATGETRTEDMKVGYVVASADALDYGSQGPAGMSLTRYLGQGSFETRQLPYAGMPSTVAYRIEELTPPDKDGNWQATELVTMTQQNRSTVQWRQVWSMQDGQLQLVRGGQPVSGEAQSAQRFLGYTLRKVMAVDQAGTANPQAAVNRRIETYNRHDLEGFLLAHAENVEIYSWPERRLGTGRSHLRRVLAGRFNDRAVQVEVLSQIVFDRFVVSDEVIRQAGSNAQVEHYVAIYEVLDNQIVSVRLIERR